MDKNQALKVKEKKQRKKKEVEDIKQSYHYVDGCSRHKSKLEQRDSVHQKSLIHNPVCGVLKI